MLVKIAAVLVMIVCCLILLPVVLPVTITVVSVAGIVFIEFWKPILWSLGALAVIALLLHKFAPNLAGGGDGRRP